MPDIASLSIGDPPSVWADLGFALTGDTAAVGDVLHHLRPSVGKGIRRWSVRGADLLAPEFDGIPTSVAPPPAAASVSAPHPNGVIALDHVVLLSRHLDRTIDQLERAGVACRRVRDTDTYGAPMRQAFFRFGPVILEVVGDPKSDADGPARFFGLAWTVRDLAVTADFLGDRLHAPKDAVQAGRRIATLDRTAGSTVAMAFMSPEPGRPD